MTTQTTTTITLQDAATEARQRADAAQRKAAEAQALADLAVTKAREAADARLCADAERCLASFDADLAAGEQRVAQARVAFNQQAATAESFTALRDHYFAWTAAAIDCYFAYRSLAIACGRLGLQTYQGRAIPTASTHLEAPAFSEALDAALALVIQHRNADREDRFHERLLNLENGVE